MSRVYDVFFALEICVEDHDSDNPDTVSNEQLRDALQKKIDNLALEDYCNACEWTSSRDYSEFAERDDDDEPVSQSTNH